MQILMSGESNAVCHNVKLPELVIDKYTGDINQYFWGQFEATVHKNRSLTKTDKFSYLRSYRTGAVSNSYQLKPIMIMPFNCYITGLAERILLLMPI